MMHEYSDFKNEEEGKYKSINIYNYVILWFQINIPQYKHNTQYTIHNTLSLTLWIKSGQRQKVYTLKNGPIVGEGR